MMKPCTSRRQNTPMPSTLLSTTVLPGGPRDQVESTGVKTLVSFESTNKIKLECWARLVEANVERNITPYLSRPSRVALRRQWTRLDMHRQIQCQLCARELSSIHLASRHPLLRSYKRRPDCDISLGKYPTCEKGELQNHETSSLSHRLWLSLYSSTNFRVCLAGDGLRTNTSNRFALLVIG